VKRERETDKPARGERGTAPPPERKPRTGPRQFLREVRVELRKVAWPSRKEVASYSLVVLVAVSVIMMYIFLLDLVFGQAVFRIFE
jgi:preprotein translocase subunit SecE